MSETISQSAVIPIEWFDAPPNAEVPIKGSVYEQNNSTTNCPTDTKPSGSNASAEYEYLNVDWTLATR